MSVSWEQLLCFLSRKSLFVEKIVIIQARAHLWIQCVRCVLGKSLEADWEGGLESVHALVRNSSLVFAWVWVLDRRALPLLDDRALPRVIGFSASQPVSVIELPRPLATILPEAEGAATLIMGNLCKKDLYNQFLPW